METLLAYPLGYLPLVRFSQTYKKKKFSIEIFTFVSGLVNISSMLYK